MSQHAYPPLPPPDQHLPSFAHSNSYNQTFQEAGTDGGDPYATPIQEHVQPQSNGNQSTPKDSASRTNRLRKACDSCSIRKVKCDEAGPPCRACAALDIPCTYERPSRRRGPPNKHAEAIKRQRLDSQQRQSSPYVTDPSSPAYLPATPATTSATPVLCADSICPIELVELLVDDFFTYVHPLVPFPHEPTFREAFRQRRDIHDRPFLAMLAGMIGALTAQFPRRPQKHLKAMGKLNIFRHSVDFVDQCRKIVNEARGPGYLERQDLNIYDAATSYFCLVMSGYVYKWSLAELYLGECFSIIRTLGFYQSRLAHPASAFGNDGIVDSTSVNLVEEELGRRIFWTIFVTVRSSKAFGIAMGEIPIRPPTPTQGYPPLPLEVDDQYIHPTRIEAQPHGILSRLSAFNTNVRIYQTMDALVALETSYSVDQQYDVERQKRVLRECLRRVKHTIDNSPEELLAWQDIASRSPSNTASLKSEISISAHPQGTQGSSNIFSPAYGEERRRIAYEIQKANVHVSYLSSRSFFVERYWALGEGATTNYPSNRQPQPEVKSPSAFTYRSSVTSPASQPSPSSVSSTSTASSTTQEIRAERESIATDLLNVLSKIRPVHMEPNNVSFIMKVRQIASTLLPGPLQTGGLADDGLAAYYLRAFLDILMDLEKLGADRPGSGEVEEDQEEAELRRWAGLREYQKQFARKGERRAGS